MSSILAVLERKKLCFFFSPLLFSPAEHCECFPFWQCLLCRGMWKGGVAVEEALGSLWGASAVSQPVAVSYCCRDVALCYSGHLQLVSGSQDGS